MPNLSIADIVESIARLGDTPYDYFTKKTKIKVSDIIRPEGPITFLRWHKDQSPAQATQGGISVNSLSTASLVFSRRPNYPIHFDKLFSGGGNSRSAFETLLAYTPHFFICYPDKANIYTGETETGLKHIMWCPDKEHPIGEMRETEFKQVISEVEFGVEFGEIQFPSSPLEAEFDSIETKRVHTQMQIALTHIGNALKFQTWIAKNDQSILVANTRLGDLEGVVNTLDKVRIFYSRESREMASLIDCIWFSDNFNFIPAAIEIEHSTGVTSGLTRMLKLHEAIPSVKMSCTIVAPNELRNKVVSEANNPAFRSLGARFMPYSTVRELYGLIQRYNLSNVVERSFVEPFMEKVVEG